MGLLAALWSCKIRGFNSWTIDCQLFSRRINVARDAWTSEYFKRIQGKIEEMLTQRQFN